MAPSKGEAAKPKGFHGQWPLTKQIIEVRSMEDGFLGSWHRGEVVGYGERRICIKYEDVLSNNATDHLVEWVPVSPVISGVFNNNQDTTDNSYRGNVRPVPPNVDLPMWSLYYGKCVDLQHEGAWWEGVIFDHEDGCDERKIFFPDMGDEMTAQMKDMRLTQDWDETTRVWKPRGDWLLLELIEEVEQEWPLIVSVKQLWYDLRGKEGFKNVKEWTSPSRELWKELLMEVIFYNLKLTAKHFFHEMSELENMKHEAHSLLEFSEPAFGDDTVAIVPFGNDPLCKRPACFSDSISLPIEMEIESNCLALDKQNPGLERKILDSPLASPGRKDCALLPRKDANVPDLANQECPPVSLKMLKHASLKKPARKLKNVTRRTRLEWLPAGHDMLPEGEYCPSAITDYIMNNRANSKYCKVKILKARKHLTYLGWKVEFARDGKYKRIRYISPSNVIYFSLIQACQIMQPESAPESAIFSELQACQIMQPESAIFSSSSEANIRDCLGASDGLISFPCTGKNLPNASLEGVHVESNYCPQAVVDYLSPDKSKPHSRKVMISEAKKHLAAIGWRFNVSRKRGRIDMQYVAPSGQAFYSLRQACQWCIREGVLSCHGEQSGELAAKALSFPSSRLDFGGDLSDNQLMVTNSMPLFSRQFSEHDVHKIHGMGKLQRCRSRDSCALVLSSKRRKSKCLSSKRRKSKCVIIQRNDASAGYSRCFLRTRRATSSTSKQTPRTILSWLIDENVVLRGARVYYRSQKDKRPTKEGRISREGIKCTCCQCVFTPSKFEGHAGSGCDRSSANIFLEDGRTLLECQLQLKHDKSLRSTISEQCHSKANRLPIRNDDMCSSCNYGGDLVLCDGCPSSFHASCISLKVVPDGDWFCPLCCCGICLSRFGEYSESESCIDEKALRCVQCEQQYHLGCFRSKGLTEFDGHPEGNWTNWFCNRKCEQIHCSLQKLLGKPIPLGLGNLTCTWLKYTNYEDSNQGSQKNEELIENYGKLNVALSVMHECFEPVKEPLTRRDLVEDVLFNRWSKLQRLNFQGFYTVLLERDEELITVATVRVHGDEVAEVPLIATRFQFRRLGMCRILMDNIEKKLLELGVESLVLPAVPSVLDTWTTSFGFSMMTESERLGFMRYIFLGFQGTVMCRKLIMNNSSIEFSQSRGVQRSTCDDFSKSDSIDVERTSVVYEVPQADLTKGSEMVDQGYAQETGCKSGYLSATSGVMVADPCRIEQNKVHDGDLVKGNDSKEPLKFLYYKRRKLCTRPSQNPQ